MKKYKNMPSELYQIVKTFYSNNLRYNLFKCEHIFKGINANLDVVFLTKQDYDKSSKILEKRGYILYMPESIEKYKRMYVNVEDNELFAIHLHREIAWHNLKILNKLDIFNRQKQQDDIIFIPSDEDSLIIHAAHIIFEDYKIKDHERKIINSLIEKKLDWSYINEVVNKAGFKKTFDYIIKNVKKNKQPKKNVLLVQFIEKAIFTPMSWFSLKLKIIKYILRKINPKRKGCLIALIGVNGSGKTTLTRKTLEKYRPITNFFNGQFGYYFGWEPFSFYAKAVSKLLKKKNKEIFNEMNYKNIEKPQKVSLFKEFIFIYNYFEYLWRYLFLIYPKLRKNKLVITDRYFYDIYGQYNYSQKSVIIKLLFSIYPRPNCLFVLNANAKTVRTRGTDTRVFSKIKKSAKREKIDIRILQSQIDRYLYLKNHFKAILINTEKNIDDNIKQIIQTSWRKLAI